jgi:predicted enzyme related to lactoylglutathione lyase
VHNAGNVDDRRRGTQRLSVGGVSYLRIPAPDPRRTAAFYEIVFGWNLRGDPEHPSFDDATGQVPGDIMPDLPFAGEAGVRP